MEKFIQLYFNFIAKKEETVATHFLVAHCELIEV